MIEPDKAYAFALTWEPRSDFGGYIIGTLSHEPRLNWPTGIAGAHCPRWHVTGDNGSSTYHAAIADGNARTDKTTRSNPAFRADPYRLPDQGHYRVRIIVRARTQVAVLRNYRHCTDGDGRVVVNLHVMPNCGSIAYLQFPGLQDSASLLDKGGTVHYCTKAPKQPNPPRVSDALWSRPEQQSPRTVPQATSNFGPPRPTRIALSEIDFIKGA